MVIRTRLKIENWNHEIDVSTKVGSGSKKHYKRMSQSTKVLWGSHDLGFCKGNGIPDLITLFYPIMIPPSFTASVTINHFPSRENWAAQPASEESWCAYWWWPSCRWSHRFGGKIDTFEPRRALGFLYMFVSFNESIETLYKFAALESPEYDHVSKIDSYWDYNATHAKLMGTWFNCTTKVGWNESLPDVSSIVCHFRIPSLKQ